MDYLNAAILAVVEGITEFLPISSTGHMILVEDYLKLGSGDFAKDFIVIIQFPAILSVVVYFWKELWPFGGGARTRAALTLWLKTAVAFLPAAVLGLLLNDYIEAMLDSSLTVALALVVGGIVLLAIEYRGIGGRIASVHGISFQTAFLIGCIQCLAMIPGTSRSAATIVGAMLLGASRPAAAEFSFFLAVPTMAGATALTVLKHGLRFSAQEWALIGIGSVVSFVIAYAVIAFLMNFVRRRSFAPFGWYRIALGGVVLLLFFLRCIG
ncbi:MAG: undecaprenyl-diphosphate phosphatase [Candidatus Hydrogenedentes bacterium]|nr:undecaprenyl-diphosphate phosphatase [Candidatus Hydrogenedentota bacterium]